MLIFQSPIFLVLLIFIPILVYVKCFKTKTGGTLPLSFSKSSTNIFHPNQKVFNFLHFISELAFFIGIIFLILSLSNTTMTKSKKMYYNNGVDIIILLDASPSMSAKNFGANSRLDAAKSVIKDFIYLRENDSIGLITFSTNALLQVPVTTDYKFLEKRLDSVQIAETGSGTSIGTGISLACLHLQKSLAQEKIIVLITDGDDNDLSIPPMSASMVASELGIKIYTIGIKSYNTAEFEYISPETGKLISGFIKPNLNEKLLQNIAENTGGLFFSSSNAKSLLTNLKKIDTLESMSKNIKVKIEKQSLKDMFMLIGFILLIINFVINKIFFGEIL